MKETKVWIKNRRYICIFSKERRKVERGTSLRYDSRCLLEDLMKIALINE